LSLDIIVTTPYALNKEFTKLYNNCKKEELIEKVINNTNKTKILTKDEKQLQRNLDSKNKVYYLA
jgi:hypothetical protein